MLAKRTGLTIVVTGFLILTSANSTLVPPLDVPLLVSEADTIALGQITSVTARGATTLDLGRGTIPANSFVAELRVDRFLKGAAPSPTLLVHFAVPESPVGIQRVVVGQYGLFFLSAGQADFRFTNPFHPTLPSMRGEKVPSGGILDQITEILGQVLESPLASDSDRSRTLAAFGSLRTPVAKDTLHHALNNTSGDAKLDIARALVARNDIAGLAPVEHALLHSTGLPENMISNLAGSLAGLKDPTSIPTLRQLLTLQDQRVTRAVAVALRQTRSPGALKPLSTLLTNDDLTARYYAVVGMGEITAQDPWTPAFDEFRDHESKYLSYWREWAALNLPKDHSK